MPRPTKAAPKLRPAARKPKEPICQSIQFTAESVLFPFGIHQGKPLGDIPTGYLEWCLRNLTSAQPRIRRQIRIVLARRAEAGLR